MNSDSSFIELVRSLVVQLPVVLVCIAGLVVAVVKWRESGGAAKWALLGFGAVLFLSFAMPVVYSMINQSKIAGTDIAQIRAFHMRLNVLWSVLRAVSYGLLLVAIFAGRRTGAPPSLPKP
ncbi:MAG: hypothetical protein ABMA13_05325 [Chthoniobacteraceae bacterium]